MEETQVLLIVLGIIFALIFLKKYLSKKFRKIIILEDIRESPDGVKKSWWVQNRQFNNIDNAREYARGLK